VRCFLQDNKYYRLIKYMKNVFDIEQLCGNLEDGRVGGVLYSFSDSIRKLHYVISKIW